MNGVGLMDQEYSRFTRLRFDRPHAKVLRVTMDSGKMNAADHVLHRELGEVWRQIDADSSVNAAILTGSRHGVRTSRR
jgi:enoyl-CoA hydratase